MIACDFLDQDHILNIRLKGTLETSDFEQLSRTVDPLLVRDGPLQGILAKAQEFSGWESFGALMGHLHFIKEHHHQIQKVVVLTDRHLLSVLLKLLDHFVSPDVRHFPEGEKEAALQWLRLKVED